MDSSAAERFSILAAHKSVVYLQLFALCSTISRCVNHMDLHLRNLERVKSVQTLSHMEKEHHPSPAQKPPEKASPDIRFLCRKVVWTVAVRSPKSTLPRFCHNFIKHLLSKLLRWHILQRKFAVKSSLSVTPRLKHVIHYTL